MFKRLTIRQRILLTFTLIVLVGSLIQLGIAGTQLGTATLEGYRLRLESDTLVTAASLANAVDDHILGERRDSGRDPSHELLHFLDALQSQVGHEFMLLDDTYHVLGATPAIGEDTGARVAISPELKQLASASTGMDIRPDASGSPRMYIAATIGSGDHLLGYLVLTQPMAPITADIQERWLELIGTTLPVIAVVVIASLWISGTISRPIQRLRNAALHMAEGELETRIPVESQDEIGQLSGAFNYMAEQVETLLKTQRSFVSNAAHELRTPLMTLKLRIEALTDPVLAQEQHNAYLRELRQEVDYMAQLVTSLLTLARIDEGRYTPEGEEYDSAALVHDIARHWRIEAQKSALAFNAEIASDLPDTDLPANDLRVVLDNLLSNALKYTHQGAVTLRAWGEKGAVKFCVSDTGLGFPLEESGELFTRFYRSAEVRAQHIPGTGLGLAIVRAILDHHRGSIAASSKGKGQGATFIVTLPAKATAG
jgi:two-component system sensor histidine kinase BaeS